MKKVLLATTMLVAGASIAAAEVTVSGDARMGIVKAGDDDATTLGTDEGKAVFTSRARVAFALSAESDSGLSYGASFRADNAGNAAGGTAGSVFISGAFGKLSMGDVDGAAQMATGNVSSTSLTGLNDWADATFIGAGGLNIANPAIPLGAPGTVANPNDTQDPTLLYEYSAGAFTGYISFTNPADSIVNVAPGGLPALNFLNSNAKAVALGAKYTFGDYTVGLGYEKVSGFIAGPGPGAAAVPVGIAAVDNTDAKHIVATVSGTVAGVTFKGLYGKASGTYSGNQIVRPGFSGKQYAASASYTAGGITGTAFYTDDSGLGGTVAYGLGASYDLGGGASLVGGVAQTKVNGPGDATAFDIGVTMKF
jgi:outer membrane protein OmpU